MSPKNNPLLWPALGLFVVSIVTGVAAVNRSDPVLITACVAEVVTGGLLLVQQKWARMLALGLIVAIVALMGYWLYSGVVSGARRALVPLLLVFLGWSAWWIWKHREVDRPLISLVWLLSQPRSLEPAILKHIVEDAWEITFEENDEENFVVGESPIFMISAEGEMFSVNCISSPYLEDPEAAADATSNLRVAKVIEEHKAWLSVDWFPGDDAMKQKDRIYQLIARLMAELASDDCLALFSPETSRMVPYEPNLIDRLREESPLELFTDIDYAKLPVVSISDDDPKMQAAVQEARDRWPEFVEALKSRSGEQQFAVKAPISSQGHTEFIWVEVTGIGGDVIFGNLGNDPVDLPGYKYGDAVEVELKDLNDWTYTLGDDVRGMFTAKILVEHAKNGN